MIPGLQRDYRNQFSDLYWKAKKAINAGDQVLASEYWLLMKSIHERAERCLFDDQLTSQFHADIETIGAFLKSTNSTSPAHCDAFDRRLDR